MQSPGTLAPYNTHMYSSQTKNRKTSSKNHASPTFSTDVLFRLPLRSPFPPIYLCEINYIQITLSSIISRTENGRLEVKIAIITVFSAATTKTMTAEYPQHFKVRRFEGLGGRWQMQKTKAKNRLSSIRIRSVFISTDKICR